MGIKDLFSFGKTISRKSLRKNYRQDPTFRKIISDPKIKKIIDRPEEQREFHNLMEGKASDGSVTGNDMREVFDDLVHKRKGKYISAEEGRRMATEFFRIVPEDIKPIVWKHYPIQKICQALHQIKSRLFRRQIYASIAVMFAASLLNLKTLKMKNLVSSIHCEA